ncbi:hypothetical protein BDQ17DRAFT_1363620 [Cyathus striatus]|nr:hypothetical protein BDQ17DRAFT_1363620 [Cyathus striatus]
MNCNSKISESHQHRLLQELGFVIDVTDESLVISCYINISCQKYFNDTAILQEFLTSNKYSGPFHCTPNDYANIFTVVISSGVVWHEHLYEFCFHWCHLIKDYMQKIPATSTLLACLMSAASDFHDNDELNQKLNRNILFYLLQWLRVSFNLHIQFK